jgi:hypothetical protein
MLRFAFAAAAALTLWVATPARACEDCKNCPHAKVASAEKAEKAGKTEKKDAVAACPCGEGKECKCGAKCECPRCHEKKAAPSVEEKKKS